MGRPGLARRVSERADPACKRSRFSPNRRWQCADTRICAAGAAGQRGAQANITSNQSNLQCRLGYCDRESGKQLPINRNAGAGRRWPARMGREESLPRASEEGQEIVLRPFLLNRRAHHALLCIGKLAGSPDCPPAVAALPEAATQGPASPPCAAAEAGGTQGTLGARPEPRWEPRRQRRNGRISARGRLPRTAPVRLPTPADRSPACRGRQPRRRHHEGRRTAKRGPPAAGAPQPAGHGVRHAPAPAHAHRRGALPLLHLPGKLG